MSFNRVTGPWAAHWTHISNGRHRHHSVYRSCDSTFSGGIDRLLLGASSEEMPARERSLAPNHFLFPFFFEGLGGG